jgi:hypothetical protein
VAFLFKNPYFSYMTLDWGDISTIRVFKKGYVCKHLEALETNFWRQIFFNVRG